MPGRMLAYEFLDFELLPAIGEDRPRRILFPVSAARAVEDNIGRRKDRHDPPRNELFDDGPRRRDVKRRRPCRLTRLILRRQSSGADSETAGRGRSDTPLR